MALKYRNRLVGAVILVCVLCIGSASAAVVDKTAPFEGEYFIAYSDRIGYSDDGNSQSGTMPSNLLSGAPRRANAAALMDEGAASDAEFDVINVRTGEAGQTIYQVEPRNLTDRVRPPEQLPQRRAAPRAASAPVLGDQRTFITVDLRTDDAVKTAFTLKYCGQNCNLWVETADARGITDEMATELGMEYDYYIHDHVTTAFGSFYDRNSDGKLAILLYDIQDGYDGNTVNSYVGGFFMPADLVGDKFNCMDVLHIDSYPSIRNGNLSEVKSTIVHELQHLIEESACLEPNPTDPTKVRFKCGELPLWINEGLSMAAEHMFYGVLDDRIDYYNNYAYINTPLAIWDDADPLSNYAYSYLFFQYLRILTKDFTGGGEELYRYIIHGENRSALCIEQAMKQFYPYITIGELFRDFRIALTLNEPTGRHGFGGEADFAAIQPHIYTGTASQYVGSGGALISRLSSGRYDPDESQAGTIRYAAFSRGSGGVDMPMASIPSGEIYKFKNVTLSCAERYATMYYTLDGSTPDENSLVYTGNPIQLLSDTDLRAVTIAPDGTRSAVASYHYTVAPEDMELVRRTVSTGYGSEAYTALATPDGCILEIGTVYRPDTGTEDFYEISAPNTSFVIGYLAKYSQSGEQLWLRTLSGPWVVYPYGAAAEEDGFVVVGTVRRDIDHPYEGDFSSCPTPPGNKEWLLSAAFIAKYDWAGNRQWITTFPFTSDRDYQAEGLSVNRIKALYDVIPCPGGGYIAVGDTGYAGESFHRMDNDNEARALAIRVDANGNLLWEKEFTGRNADLTGPDRPTSGFQAAAFLSDGTVAAVGYVRADIFGGGDWADVAAPEFVQYLPSNFLLPAVIAFRPSDGAVLWKQVFEPMVYANYTAFSDIIPLSGGDFIAAGQHHQRDLPGTFVLRAHVTGSGCSTLWTQRFGDYTPDPVLAPAEDGVLVFGSYASSNSLLDPTFGLSPVSLWDILAAKVDLNGNLVWAQNFASNYQPDGGGYNLYGAVSLGNRKYAVVGWDNDRYVNGTSILPRNAFLFTLYDESTPYYTVSGNVGLPGVSIGTQRSDSQGNFSLRVKQGDRVTLTPSLPGYTFSPASRSVGPVAADSTNNDFTPQEQRYTIEGTVYDKDGRPLSGVSVGSAVTGADGKYRITVRPGVTVVLTPQLAGATFEPQQRTFSAISASAGAQDFRVPKPRYTISGTVTRSGKAQGGVLVGGVLTKPDGTYSITVEEGATITLSPLFQGYLFEPSQVRLAAVAENKTQNFTMALPRLQLSPNGGSLGTAQEGYSSVPGRRITVTNIGASPCTGLRVSVPADSNFEVTLPDSQTLAAGASTFFTVTPMPGLPIGDYSGLVTVSGDDGISLTITVTFSVTKKSQPANPGGGSSAPPEPEPPAIHEPYLKGAPDGSFQPEASLTRAECAAIFTRCLGGSEEDKSAAPCPYPDVDREAWYAGAVDYLSARGGIRGYPDGTFQPENSITRGEFASMLCQVLNLEPAPSSGFPDVGDHWAAGAIGALVRQGIIKGYPDGTFRPDQPVTRAEAVRLANLAFGRAADPERWSSRNIPVPFFDLSPAHWAYYDILEASVLHDAAEFHASRP